MPTIFARKTYVEYIFKASPTYYSQFPKLLNEACEMLNTDAFSVPTSWTAEVVSIENRLRIVIDPKSILIEFDAFQEAEERPVEVLKDQILTLIDKHPNRGATRVGTRRDYALTIDKLPESLLIKKIAGKHLNTAELVKSSGMSLSDLAITLELKDENDSRFVGRIIYGAMEKKQWLSRVKYLTSMYTDAPTQDALRDQILESLPSDFVFLDLDLAIDSSKNDEPLNASDVNKFWERLKASGKSIPCELIKEIAK